MNKPANVKNCNPDAVKKHQFECFRHAITTSAELAKYLTMWEIMYSKKWNFENDYLIDQDSKDIIKENFKIKKIHTKTQTPPKP